MGSYLLTVSALILILTWFLLQSPQIQRFLPESLIERPRCPPWSYEGSSGPSGWGSLCAEYAVCDSGKQQSPVNLPLSAEHSHRSLDFHEYGSCEHAIAHNGPVPLLTLSASDNSSNSVLFDGQEYHLAQFHFHTPAEHTIAGKTFPVELHLVHLSEKGNAVVLGILMERGTASNPTLSHFLEQLDTLKKEKNVPLNAAKLLPASTTFYHYTGSLTTPPCTEGVQWFVVKQPTQVTEEQISALHKAMGTSNRPVQPLHGRTVNIYGAE